MYSRESVKPENVWNIYKEKENLKKTHKPIPSFLSLQIYK